MAEAVAVATESETITDIQNYLQTFNKDIENENVEAAVTATIVTDQTENDQEMGDTIYAIDAKDIVLTDQVADGQTDQSGSYQTFMVMDDQQQYMLIMPDSKSATDSSEQPTIAVVSSEVPEDDTVINAKSIKTESSPPETPVSTPKRGLRPRKTIKDQDDSCNDISVYDFNDQPNRNANASILANNTKSNDPDYKTPSKPRGRPPKSGDSGRRSKSGNGSISLNTSASGANSNVHVCTYCNYTSTKRYLLSRHLKSHSEDRPHKCGICERGFKTLASLQNHVNTHTGVRPHQCKFCEAAFTTSGELVRHIRYRHTHEKPHRCTECDYASVELSKLKRHMRCHTGERPYQCPHCTYASPDTYKLKRHLRIHTGEKPYLCDVCQQRFTQSNSLKAHKLIHTGNKPVFKCEFCPTTCGRKTDLRIHVQKLHTSDKMLTCKRCDQSFPDRYQFKLHLKTHEGEKCFKCDLCTYASVSARHLESHMLIHTDQKPFLCEVCNLSFRQKQLLKRHKNLYHNPTYVAPTPKEKTHECSRCGKAFRHKGNLIRHMAHHDEDSKKSMVKEESDSFDTCQLIDDDIYEGEEEYETADESGTVSIVTDTSLLDTTSATVSDGTISITLDPQTQELINSGNDQLMLVVVPNSEDDDGSGTLNSANGQSTIAVAVTTSNTSTPRIISRSGRTTRSSTKNISNTEFC
ncbi:hypothetical protein SSS_07115 [Sarcoptes scabiei]|nr:hypothetical protein SSS_07115 [Sarcoptes scabiei]